jgi:hypothetical protein
MSFLSSFHCRIPARAQETKRCHHIESDPQALTIRQQPPVTGRQEATRFDTRAKYPIGGMAKAIRELSWETDKSIGFRGTINKLVVDNGTYKSIYFYKRECTKEMIS